MKQNISPAVAAIIIVIVLAIAAFAVMRGTSTLRGGEVRTGMPPEVAAEFAKRAGGMTGPAGGTR